MSVKPLIYLMSALASAGMVIEPVSAAAAGLSQPETWGKPKGTRKTVSNLRCDGTAGIGGNSGGGALTASRAKNSAHNPAQTNNKIAPSTTTVFVIGGGGSNLSPPLNLTVDNSSDNAGTNTAAGQCRFTDTTVVKAIHAICVSEDGHEFPAPHMIPDTWISSSYEGEIARCLPGSVLKVMIGSVVMSDQGLAVSLSDAQVLSCGPGMAVRHFKGGLLKCAGAQTVADGTERSNLRKWGTGDMFFTYVTRVCLELKRAMVP
jgi:hypothetical protein